MLHSRFVIARIEVGGVDLPLRHGALVVAARAESDQLDWEAVVHTIDVAEVDQATHPLVLECLAVTAGASPAHDDLDALLDRADGESSAQMQFGVVPTVRMCGPAFLVRAVDTALVFRGAGRLDGFDIGDLVG